MSTAVFFRDSQSPKDIICSNKDTNIFVSLLLHISAPVCLIFKIVLDAIKYLFAGDFVIFRRVRLVDVQSGEHLDSGGRALFRLTTQTLALLVSTRFLKKINYITKVRGYTRLYF